MSCCRPGPSRRSGREPQNIPAPCKILEQGGSGLKLWPKNIGGAYALMVQDPESSSFIDVLAFLRLHGCQGPVSRMLQSNAQRVLSAFAKNPAAFQTNGAGGFTLVKLLRTADAVFQTGSNHAKRIHPFARR